MPPWSASSVCEYRWSCIARWHASRARSRPRGRSLSTVATQNAKNAGLTGTLNRNAAVSFTCLIPGQSDESGQRSTTHGFSMLFVTSMPILLTACALFQTSAQRGPYKGFQGLVIASSRLRRPSRRTSVLSDTKKCRSADYRPCGRSMHAIRGDNRAQMTQTVHGSKLKERLRLFPISLTRQECRVGCALSRAPHGLPTISLRRVLSARRSLTMLGLLLRGNVNLVSTCPDRLLQSSVSLPVLHWEDCWKISCLFLSLGHAVSLYGLL